MKLNAYIIPEHMSLAAMGIFFAKLGNNTETIPALFITQSKMMLTKTLLGTHNSTTVQPLLLRDIENQVSI